MQILGTSITLELIRQNRDTQLIRYHSFFSHLIKTSTDKLISRKKLSSLPRILFDHYHQDRIVARGFSIKYNVQAILPRQVCLLPLQISSTKKGHHRLAKYGIAKKCSDNDKSGRKLTKEWRIPNATCQLVIQRRHRHR